MAIGDERLDLEQVAFDFLLKEFLGKALRGLLGVAFFPEVDDLVIDEVFASVGEIGNQDFM